MDEVVLGAKLADSLGAEVGDRVPLTSDVLEGEPDEVTVTGIGAVAGMGFELDPGTSALVSPEVAELYPDSAVSVLLVRFADDADREARLAELRERFPLTVLVAPVPSRSVQTLDGLRALPVALAVTVALLALAAGANAALASVRRRRRELAIVKVLGLQRAEVRRVVTWQAVAWAVAALLVGLPLGLLLGSVGLAGRPPVARPRQPLHRARMGGRGPRARGAAAPRRPHLVAGSTGGRHGSGGHAAIGVTPVP